MGRSAEGQGRRGRADEQRNAPETTHEASLGNTPVGGEEFERALWDLLSRELGRLGAAGGGFGGALVRGPVGGPAGALGGWLGARLSRLFLRRERATRTLELPVPPERALELVRAAIERVGRVERMDVAAGAADRDARGPAAAPAAERPGRVGPLVGVVRAGFFNMNPAAVVAWAEPADAGGSQLELMALAFEGLVKQRTAAGALRRVCGVVESLGPTHDY